jgi:hypothetical protein
MRSLKIVMFLLVSLMMVKPVAAQVQENAGAEPSEKVTGVKRSALGGFFNGLELRQSFGSAGTRNSAARFQLTIPRHEEASYLIDGGLGLPFTHFQVGKSLTMEGKVVGEYHRNSLIDEEQHNWQTGFSGTIRTNIRRNPEQTSYKQWYFTPTLKFSRNLQDTASSIIFNMDAIPFRSGEKGINLNTYTIRGSRKLIHLLALNPGLEFQKNFSAKQKANDGTILRPLLKFQYLLAGNRERTPEVEMIAPDKTWEISLDYTARYAVVNSTLRPEKFTQLFRAGADYYLLTNPIQISFGLSYNYGSDPAQGLKKQHFYLATFSLQK